MLLPNLEKVPHRLDQELKLRTTHPQLVKEIFHVPVHATAADADDQS